MSHLSVVQAMYSTLTSSAALMNKVTGVFDVVPEGQGSPYISLGYQQALRGRLLNEKENVWYFNLDIWSDYQGRKEVLEIADLIKSAIQPEWFFDELIILEDESGWYHGILTIKGYDCEDS